jgi:hypothetical protein
VKALSSNPSTAKKKGWRHRPQKMTVNFQPRTLSEKMQSAIIYVHQINNRLKSATEHGRAGEATVTLETPVTPAPVVICQ